MRWAFSVVALLSLVGCGGIKSGQVTPSWNLRVNPVILSVGTSCTVSWDANFATTSPVANFTGSVSRLGSVQDTPAISTTYTLTSGSVLESQTVAVTLLSKSIALVASDPNTITALRDLTRQSFTGTFDTFGSVPAASTAYDVLILHGSADLQASDAATVEQWLSAGKSVCVLGTAGNELASGDATNPNTLNIAPWLGASTLFVDGFESTGQLDSTSSPILLSAVLRRNAILTAPDVRWYSSTDDARLRIGATKLVREGIEEICGYTFEPEIGGKLFFLGSAIGSSGTSWGDLFRCGLIHITR